MKKKRGARISTGAPLAALLLGLAAWTGSAQAAMLPTVEGITLYGGSGGTNWSSNGQTWDTVGGNGIWALGVSLAPNGSLINQPDTSIAGAPFDAEYWLYAEPTSLGPTPKLAVRLEGGGLLEAVFEVSGTPGVGNTWTLLSGAPFLALGWADGSANKVGSGEALGALGSNDFYLKATVGTVMHAPLPGAAALFVPALAALAAFGRRRRAQR